MLPTWSSLGPSSSMRRATHGYSDRSEFAFRSIAEEKATRAISHLIANAPDVANMEFFGTQLIDEARHSRVFRSERVRVPLYRRGEGNPRHQPSDCERSRCCQHGVLWDPAHR